jgi:hypothetical protein
MRNRWVYLILVTLILAAAVGVILLSAGCDGGWNT